MVQPASTKKTIKCPSGSRYSIAKRACLDETTRVVSIPDAIAKLERFVKKFHDVKPTNKKELL